jgi:outer membrane immunogenic protein
MAMSIQRWRRATPLSSRSIIVAAALCLIGAVQALAADIEVPTAPPPNAPVNYFTRPVDWGGLYLGVNGGYAFGTSVWTNAGLSTGNFNANGGLVGGTLGINYANGGGFLFGIEVDADWSGLIGSSSITACTGLGTPAGTACGTKSDWLSTGRLRLGYAFDRILVFGTAGAAIGDFEIGLNPPGGFRRLPVQLGWTAGGGIEYAFTDYLTAKVEYLFVDLGTVSCPLDGTCGPLQAASVSLTENLVRAGFNYKFTW